MRVPLSAHEEQKQSGLSPALDVLQFTKQTRFIGGLHHIWRLMHGVCQFFEISINALEAP